MISRCPRSSSRRPGRRRRDCRCREALRTNSRSSVRRRCDRQCIPDVPRCEKRCDAFADTEQRQLPGKPPLRDPIGTMAPRPRGADAKADVVLALGTRLNLIELRLRLTTGERREGHSGRHHPSIGAQRCRRASSRRQEVARQILASCRRTRHSGREQQGLIHQISRRGSRRSPAWP